MAVRFDIDYPSYYEVDWSVDIHDTLGTPVGSFDVADRGVIPKFTGLTRDMQPGVFPTSVNIPFTVSTAQQEFLIDDIRSGPEDRFYCEVFRDGVLFYRGRFAIEGISIPDKYRPYKMTLITTDGLSGLKYADYPRDGDKDSLLDVIGYCLNETGLASLYGTDNILSVSLDIYENNMGDLTADPLGQIRVNEKIFRDKPETPAKCWNVLDEICKLFGARLYYCEGMYHFEQLVLRKEDTWRRFYYQYSSGLVATTTDVAVSKELDIDQVRVADAGDGRFTVGGSNSYQWLPPLRAVTIEHRFAQENFAQGQTWSDADETEKSLGFAIINSGTTARIKGLFDSNVDLVGSFSGASSVDPLRFVWKITLKIGTVQLWRQLYFDQNGGTFWTPVYQVTNMGIETSPTTSDVIGATDGAAWTWEDGTGGEILAGTDGLTSIDMSSIPFAAELTAGGSYEVRMKVELDKVYNANLTDIQSDPDYDFTWEFRNVEFTLSDYAPGTSVQVGAKYTASNDVTGNLKTLEYSTRLGDAPNADAGLEIYNGTDWQYAASDWSRDGYALSVSWAVLKIVARDLLSIQKSPRKFYRGSFVMPDFTFDSRIEWDTRYFLPLSGQQATRLDEFSGSYMEISQDDPDDIPDDDPEEIIEQDISQTPIDPPGVDPPPGQTPVPPPGLVADESIGTSSPYTSIDVQNNAGLEVDAGTWLIITNITTGETELVQLTAALGAADTSISISSYTFSSAFPLGSPIGVSPVEQFDWVQEVFTADATAVSNNYVTVTGPLADPAAFSSDRDYFKNARVWRGASRLLFSSAATSAMGSGEYGVDKANERVTFPDDWNVIKGEQIVIEYKIPLS